MSSLKDRTVNLAVIKARKDVNGETVGYTILRSVDFFVKTISYDLQASGASFKGIGKSDTLQWYSEEYTFTLSGDSYVSPFSTPTLMAQDQSIQELIALYREYFSEGAFAKNGVGTNKFQLTINNNPALKDDAYIGVITSFKCDETDDSAGLIKFDITFEGKSSSYGATTQAKDNFFKDLALNTANTLKNQAKKLIGG